MPRTASALTPEGRAWAEANRRKSIVARVALYGDANGWPAAHVTFAIRVCNDNGAERRAA